MIIVDDNTDNTYLIQVIQVVIIVRKMLSHGEMNRTHPHEAIPLSADLRQVARRSERLGTTPTPLLDSIVSRCRISGSVRAQSSRPHALRDAASRRRAAGHCERKTAAPHVPPSACLFASTLKQESAKMKRNTKNYQNKALRKNKQ